MIIFDLHTALLPYLETTPDGQVFVLVDTQTAVSCLPLVSEAINGVPFHIITIPAGESNKSLHTVQHVWDVLFEHHATRQALLLNIGGGMVTDIGGFVAATYMRGIRCMNIPTSLLAMVDASSGGKTGFNYQGIKNLIGTFTQPLATLIYPPFLRTLPPAELLSGYAEMLKHGLIADREYFYALLAALDAEWEDLSSLIAPSIAIKEDVVSSDFNEKNRRKILNFGHTIGHAIEEAYAAQSRPVAHGYCVMWGMVAELYLSVICLGFPREVLSQMSHLMLVNYGRPECDCRQRDQLIERMLHDKKNLVQEIQPSGLDASININFTLLRQIGEPLTDQFVTIDELNEALEYLFSL